MFFLKQQGKSGPYPLAIILDGEIQEDTLKQIKRSKNWLLDMLSFKGVALEEVFYAFIEIINFLL